MGGQEARRTVDRVLGRRQVRVDLEQAVGRRPVLLGPGRRLLDALGRGAGALEEARPEAGAVVGGAGDGGRREGCGELDGQEQVGRRHRPLVVPVAVREERLGRKVVDGRAECPEETGDDEREH